jgi:WD40 repeat protein
LDLNQNDLIVTGFNDGAIKIWKSLPQSPFIRLHRQLLGHSASVNSLFIYNSSVFLSSAEDGTVKLWNIKTGDCVRTLNVTTRNEYRTIFGLVTLSDGRIITGDSSVSNIANSSSNIKIWKDSTPHLIASLPTTIFNMEVVGNGAYLAVATGRNCKTCNTTVHARHDRGSIYLYFLNDPSQFFVLGDTGLPNDQDLSNYPGYYHTDNVVNLKSISNNLFASSSADYTVKVWNLTALFNEMSSGAPLTLNCQFGYVLGLEYDKKAQRLITGSYDGLISIYSLQQGTAQYGNLLGSYNSGMEAIVLRIVNINGHGGSIVANNKASVQR